MGLFDKVKQALGAKKPEPPAERPSAQRTRSRRGGRGRGRAGRAGQGTQATQEKQKEQQPRQRGEGRRSRGGRRGGRSGQATAERAERATTTPAEEKQEAREKGKRKSTRSRRTGRGRKRERTRRGSASSGSQRRVLDANERPKNPVKKQILINASDPNEIRVAIREQQRVVEVYVERKGKRSLAGNIYKGRVQNVLPGMEAAFVDIGLEKNGFLYVDEVTPAAADSDQKMPVRMATGGAPVDDATIGAGGDLNGEPSGDEETLDINAAIEDESEEASPVSNDATPSEAVEEASAGATVAERGGDAVPSELAGPGAAVAGAAAATTPPATTTVSANGNGKGRRGGRRGRAQGQGKRKIQELLSPGQEILVQVVKDPMGTKGSRLTTQYSLAGRYLVYVPDGEGLGVSRRLEDSERERLREIVKGFDLPAGGGLIVRTAAEGAAAEDIGKDLQLLLKLHEKLMEQSGGQRAPKLLYNEADLSLRIIRDLFNDEVESVIVDDERQYQRIQNYLKRTSPTLTERVELYQGSTPLFELHGVEDAIKSTVNKRVNLPGGGYLIIDYAEAFTVIDVNTGRNVGKTSLEETITKTNMEAAEEIVRQLRLRDIGGIIVVDFIDMNLMKNRDAVLEHYRKELSKDRTKTYLVEISPLGLVEMTRQNVSDGVREILTSTCRTCEGRGVVVSAETHAIEVERAVAELASGLDERIEAVAIETHPEVQQILAGSSGKQREMEKRAGKVVRVLADPELETNAFAVRAQGTRDEIVSMPEPLRRGQQLKLVVEEVDPLNEADGIARYEGTVITIVGAAGDVGQERTITIAAAEGARALATVVRPARRRRRRGGRGRRGSGAAAATQAAAAAEAATGDTEEAAAADDVAAEVTARAKDATVPAAEDVDEDEDLDDEDLDDEDLEDEDLEDGDEDEEVAPAEPEEDDDSTEIPERVILIDEDEDEDDEDDDSEDDDSDDDDSDDEETDDDTDDDDPDDEDDSEDPDDDDSDDEDDSDEGDADDDLDDEDDDSDDAPRRQRATSAAAARSRGAGDAEGEAGERPARRRRRGSRGGRGRRGGRSRRRAGGEGSESGSSGGEG